MLTEIFGSARPNANDLIHKNMWQWMIIYGQVQQNRGLEGPGEDRDVDGDPCIVRGIIADDWFRVKFAFAFGQKQWS